MTKKKKPVKHLIIISVVLIAILYAMFIGRFIIWMPYADNPLCRSWWPKLEYGNYYRFISNGGYANGLFEIGRWRMIEQPKQPFAGHQQTGFAYELHKNTITGRFRLTAFLAKNDKGLPNTGNPLIFIRIPEKQIEHTLKNGLSADTITRFITTAHTHNWQPVIYNQLYQKQADIELKYTPK